MSTTQQPSRPYLITKSVLDWLLAGTALVVISPAFAIIAILIRVTSPGPVFFRQNRLGRNASVFKIFKFRTMVVHTASTFADQITYSADPRITPLGRVLRDFRLDELPQLLNVIRGEMSIVGPRPLTPEFYPYYSDKDKQRLALRPGITGWQQVNGASNHSWSERIDLDVWYVQHANLWLDLKIMWRTIGVALTREGVYACDGSQLSGIPDALRATMTEELNSK